MSTILKAQNISKQYRLGLVGTGSLKHDLNRWWHKINGKEDPYLKMGAVNYRDKKATEEYIWALRDINYEVKTGEVLGLIGQNGAGKSTLLKILSRVTSPTTGTIKTKGRIASLLEVGTGFHGELTGRENIYMNGAVLGMTKQEINRKIDEIIDFSGCEMYIDTPIKRYSSGMTVRLGFAVAAHLEPEILVVDEVLAVGDAEFQKKAIGKMQDLSRGQGRTVLFVSHNMASIQSLCTRTIVLENGGMSFGGNTNDAINFYLNSKNSVITENFQDRIDREGNGKLEFIDYSLTDEKNKRLTSLYSGQKVIFKLKCRSRSQNLQNLKVSFTVYKKNGELLATFMSQLTNESFSLKNSNEIIFGCIIEKLPFMGGKYNCSIIVWENENIADYLQNAFEIEVIDGDFFGKGKIVPKSHVSVLVNHHWYLPSNF
ncbi:lipopolysaccharide transport system ATP-binding protein [Salinimicrobium sediminis]|uniref:Lipopolysaccharide transport system ATP-binding protein n=1 Tax=Salinimicrobium sediminis TaxID=1343891 RepID=A0A285WZQ8_9FLAO|nr:ABC transporter ATP-binding protein [Salinimicrobium sediminis]SOC78575.1 lipopolysaccharide transport system ATP-binding protein [Salinimicrobium sediminis]